jgi:methylated-DNA-[protein]-cysteine S-methyltransferase
MNIGAIKTPVGHLGLVEENGQITRLIWNARDSGERTAVLDEGLRQLGEFFDGVREVFDLPLAPEGSEFQQQVYAAMLKIPKGQTRTYGSIARELGVPAQPVGQACGANPIPVIIPCHRVVASDGLGGFSGDGGVEMKIALLKFEQAYSLLL